MSLDIIEDRMRSYSLKTKQDEEQALKEICQEIALSALSRSNFFKIGAFQGGTCLRILHGLKRFSEDLDFILRLPSTDFTWKYYSNAIEEEFAAFGLNVEIMDRSESPGQVKRAFLKEDSFGQVLVLKHKRAISDKQKLLIKLEIDTNPPSGSEFETQYLDFPFPFSIVCQDLPSLFASKCHALLCRPYTKGRDWYDFLWYIKNRTMVNYLHLKYALEQTGPYQNKPLEINKEWLRLELEKKILTINWDNAKQDIEPFLFLEEKRALSEWSAPLFLSMLKKLQ